MKGNQMINKMKKVVLLLALISISVPSIFLQAESSLNFADQYPHFSTDYPREYLSRARVQEIKGSPLERKDGVSISGSAFYQSGDKGYNASGAIDNNLWDLKGKWSLVGLLYGNVPTGKARTSILQSVINAATCYKDTTNRLDDENYTDLTKAKGFMSISGNYKKQGVRFEVSGRIAKYFGISIKTGFSSLVNSDLKFTPDITSDANIKTALSDKYAEIAQEIGLNLNEYNKSSLEDLRLEAFWKQGFYINK